MTKNSTSGQHKKESVVMSVIDCNNGEETGELMKGQSEFDKI
jgi:hypothetical protein